MHESNQKRSIGPNNLALSSFIGCPGKNITRCTGRREEINATPEIPCFFPTTNTGWVDCHLLPLLGQHHTTRHMGILHNIVTIVEELKVPKDIWAVPVDISGGTVCFSMLGDHACLHDLIDSSYAASTCIPPSILQLVSEWKLPRDYVALVWGKSCGTTNYCCGRWGGNGKASIPRGQVRPNLKQKQPIKHP